jgi:4-diphosphocytidyl-2-C-methyl-D-erythritol kinase
VSGRPAAARGSARAELEAPAKLNLGLRVVGRRADGFHEIESVFVPIDLSDTLEIETAPAAAAEVSLALDAEVGGVPDGAQNLAAQAAVAFLERARLAAAVRIRLRKRIPAAAGLGGGSSDAGAVLAHLARCFPAALDAARLADLALRLGADVPYFLDPRPALVRGVGERIEPLAGLPPLPLLLVRPELPLPTREVFRAFDALRPAWTGPGGDVRPPLSLWADAAARSAALAGLLENDLEPAAVRLCPPVARLRERLRRLGALGVGMSGSGPTVFGIFADAAAARTALAELGCAPSLWARVATSADSR